MILNTHETESWWMEQMLDKANMVTSYKAYWLMGVVEIITEDEIREISFSDVVNRMIVNAWYTVTAYRLSFGVQDRLSHLVKYLSSKYLFLNDLSKSKLLSHIENDEILKLDKEFMDKKKSLYQMVPFRLLTPFFREATRGIKDQKKNKLIVELAKESSEVFYQIDLANQSIIIRPTWMDYMIRNQALIKGWIQYKLVLYLQARNPNVPNIPLKIMPPNKRNLTKAKKFWKSVTETEVIHDIYTGKLFNRMNYDELGEMSIDHFIPWSFVSHDEFWNLCPTFNNINSAKNDALPDLDKYLNEFCELHYLAINKLKSNSYDKKILEDYYTIGDTELVHLIGKRNVNIERNIIEDSIKKSIQPIHQIALNQGFRIWES